MQFAIADSITDDMTLALVTARLAQNTAVTGILWLGTTGTAQHTVYSDYDLLLVMGRLAEPVHVIFTTIDGVWSDIIFVEKDAIDEMLTATELTLLSRERGDLMHWLVMGAIQHDADGLLAQVQQRLRTDEWRQSAPEHTIFAAWRKINYNFALYEQMARRALAPVGGLWSTAPVSISLTSATPTPEDHERAVAFWETLLRG